MTKKEICESRPAFAYYSGFGGFEIHDINYGINDYIIGVSGAWGNPKNRSYHRLKLYYNPERGFYFKLHGYRCYLADCIRMGAG